MSTYSIAQIEDLTGIKAHTIRMWEQRYNFLKPKRTGTNIRFYGDNEIKKLLNTSLLINIGYKISKIASYSEKEISSIINKMISDSETTDIFCKAIINELMTAGLIFNESKFEKGISSAILKLGLKETYIRILYPLIVKLGMMWTTSELSPGQEHFISNLVRQKIFSAINSLPIPTAPKRKWILFLPEEEDHETGLLFSSYLLKQAGHSVIYLGPKVPYESLHTTALVNKPTDMLFFIVRHFPKTYLQKLLKNIERDFKKQNVVLSANKNLVNGIKPNSKLNLVTSVDDFENYIKRKN